MCRALAWSFFDSSALSLLRGEPVVGTTIKEVAVLRLLLQEKASPSHVRVALCILKQKNTYLSLEDIEKETLLKNGKLKKIMNYLAGKKLVQKEGCLFKKFEFEKIAEII